MKTTTAPPDITVRYGDVHDKLTNIIHQGVRSQIAPGHFMLKIDGVAKYLLKNGNEVTIEPYGHVNEDDIRVFFLSSLMGVICHQRGLLPLHASSIAIDDGCVLFAGGSAIGKSTIAAAFHEKGYSLLSDDICSISLDSQGVPIVSPGYIQLKLWADSLKLLKINPKLHRKLRYKINKYSVIVENGMCKKPMRIKKIYMLVGKNSKELILTPLKGRAKFNPVISNTIKFNFVKRAGSIPTYFNVYKQLYKSVNITKVSKQFRLPNLKELINIMEKDFTK